MKLNIIKKLTLVILFISLIVSCQQKQDEMPNVIAKAQVKITKITQGYLPDYIQLTGKTIYLNKSSLVAPISGYITKVNVRQGDKVKKGDLLFEMQTPEAYVMKQKDSTANAYGFVKIYAPDNGRVVSSNIVNTSVYADKGAVMCILMASNDLKIQINVPFEYKRYANIGNKCLVVLPDNTKIEGHFSKVLPQIDEISQTVKILANINTQQFIPENMIVSILLDKSTEYQAQIIAKQCLQSDALMQRFWVMKLINDSTAVQVNVEIAKQTHNKVEIISPLFSKDDSFISEGAYGLSDTVWIEIKH